MYLSIISFDVFPFPVCLHLSLQHLLVLSHFCSPTQWRSLRFIPFPSVLYPFAWFFLQIQFISSYWLLFLVSSSNVVSCLTIFFPLLSFPFLSIHKAQFPSSLLSLTIIMIFYQFVSFPFTVSCICQLFPFDVIQYSVCLPLSLYHLHRFCPISVHWLLCFF
jgi:hypothetical protein